MKKLFAIVSAIVIISTSFVACADSQSKSFSNYTEVCNTESYRENIVSVPVTFSNFSIGKYTNIYASYDGSICKFYDSGELRTIYEDTFGFSAPYYYNDYVYAVSNGYLYRIENNSDEISAVSEEMDGVGANCVVVNDSFALITLHHYDENGKFSIKLMRVDLASGEATELDLGTEQRIYCSAGGVMYVYTKEVVDRETVYSLYEIPTDGEPIYICDMTDIGEVPRFVLESGMFYYADASGNLCAKSMADGEAVKCVAGANIYGTGNYSETGMAFVEGNIFYYNAGTGCIESVYIPDLQSNKVSVSICQTYAGLDIDFNKLAELTDISVTYSTKNEENSKLKIMAGDSDVDIYFITATLARTLLDKNIYTPINSEIISDFNDSCFDYIAEACLADTGEIVLVPISSYVPAVVYPIEAQEEVGFEREDLLYYDSFMEIAKNHNTGRIVFQTADVIYEGMHAQYEKYYCDFENNKFDYTTDLYKGFYGELLSYHSEGESQVHDVFVNPNQYVDERHPEAGLTSLKGPNHYSDITLFSAGRYEYYWYADQCPTFFDEWRAVPIPRISDQVTGNYMEVTFAYINPYSENKESAVMALEAIVQNLQEVSCNDSGYSFLYKDKSVYGKEYHPDSQVFNDFYDIASEGFLSDYRLIYELRDDMRQYTNNLISLDEAVAMYQRQIEIWLNE